MMCVCVKIWNSQSTALALSFWFFVWDRSRFFSNQFGPVHGVAVASGGHCHLAPLLRSSPSESLPSVCSDSGQCSKQHADDMIAEARCPSKITQHTYIHHKIRTAAVVPRYDSSEVVRWNVPLSACPSVRCVNMYQYGARVVWELRQPLHQPRGCTVCMTG